MTEPAVPGVEEIARLLMEVDNAHIDRTRVEPVVEQLHLDMARAIFDRFAPILAGNERLARIAEAYAACESVARKRVDHIDPALEERLPALCKISRETWLAHKQRAPIMAVDMLEYAKRQALEARALAAEAALAGAEQRCAEWAEKVAAAIRAQGE